MASQHNNKIIGEQVKLIDEILEEFPLSIHNMTREILMNELEIDYRSEERELSNCSLEKLKIKLKYMMYTDPDIIDAMNEDMLSRINSDGDGDSSETLYAGETAADYYSGEAEEEETEEDKREREEFNRENYREYMNKK